MITTRRKTKVVGDRTFIDQESGELVKMHVMEVEERDCNFEKLWIGHIAQTLEIIGNQKMKVLTYVLRHRNSENIFISTQRKLQNELGISGYTITQTFKALQDADFLTKIHSGAYRINPNVVFKGSYGNRMDVLIRYRDEKAKNGEESAESREETLNRKIEEVQRELERLKTLQQKQKPALKLAK